MAGHPVQPGSLTITTDAHWEHLHRLLPGSSAPSRESPPSRCYHAGVHLCTEWGQCVNKLRNEFFRITKITFHKTRLEHRRLFLQRKMFARFAWSSEDPGESASIVAEELGVTVVQLARVQF